MWIGRRYRNTRIWFSSQWRIVKLSVLIVALISPCLFCCGGAFLRGQYINWFVLTAEDRDFFEASRTSRHQYREGVPSAARKLIAEMDAIDDPDAAVALHTDWFQHRFSNGEWIFGHGIDSHGLSMAGQGTLVIKDSRGRTRVFFGHVCGTNGGFPWILRYANTLDEMEKEEYFAMTYLEWFP